MQAGGTLSSLPSAILTNGCVKIVPGTANPLATPSPPVQAYWEYWAGPIAMATPECYQRQYASVHAKRRSDLHGADGCASDPGRSAHHSHRSVAVVDTIPHRPGPGSGYTTPPMVEGILLNTVPSTNAVTEQDVLLGASNGLPNQTLQLPLFPVLPHPAVTGIIAVDRATATATSLGRRSRISLGPVRATGLYAGLSERACLVRRRRQRRDPALALGQLQQQ